MSVYWIVFKTSIWTQDLLGGFPYSSAVDGFKWMSRLWSTPKNLGNSFSDPQEVSTTLLLPVPGKCFPNLQFLGCHHHVGVSSSRSAKQQTNREKCQENSADHIMTTQTWSWLESPRNPWIHTSALKKRSNSHIDEFYQVRQGKLPRKFLNIRNFSACFLVSNSFFS